jgi:hypothetical protein
VIEARPEKQGRAEALLAEIETLVGQVRPLDAELAAANVAKEVAVASVNAAREIARELTSRRDPVARAINETITELGAFLGLGPTRIGGGGG